MAVGFVLATVLFGAEFVTQLKALNERAAITLSRLAAFLGLKAEDIVNGQSAVASIAPLIPRFIRLKNLVNEAAGVLEAQGRRPTRVPHEAVKVVS